MISVIIIGTSQYNYWYCNNSTTRCITSSDNYTSNRRKYVRSRGTRREHHMYDIIGRRALFVSCQSRQAKDGTHTQHKHDTTDKTHRAAQSRNNPRFRRTTRVCGCRYIIVALPTGRHIDYPRIKKSRKRAGRFLRGKKITCKRSIVHIRPDY